MLLKTACLLIFATLSLRAAPVLGVDRMRHDFGEVPPGTPVRTTFWVSNDGDGVLEILRVLPACDCTTVAVDRRFLKARERAAVAVTFDPIKDKGHVERSLLVVSNAPQAAKVELVIEAEVVFGVMANAEAVFFPGTLRHDLTTREVKVKSHGGKDLKLALVAPPPPFLQVALSGQGTQAVIQVTMDGSKLPASGGANGLLRFATGIPEQPELPLEYYWHVGHAVEAQPEGLAFDPQLTGSAQTLEVTLVATRERPFRILGLKSVTAPFQAKVLSSGSAVRHQLQVSLGAGVGAGTHRGAVVLKIEDPDQDEVEIPVTADLQ